MAKEMAKNLKKTNVKNVTLNQMNIINAIKTGDSTPTKIAETLTMSEHIVKSILGTLIKNNIIVKNDDGKSETTFALASTSSGKKIKLVGDLNFPVSSFTDASGQRYVTRDTWHKIDEDIDIVNDIEWVDSKTTQNEKIKEIMKEASKKKSQGKKTSKLATEAPASEEQRKLISKSTIDHIIINDNWKMRILEISAVSAVVVFSPRLFTSTDTNTIELSGEHEFTHGLLTKPETITVEELDEYLKNAKVPNYTKENVEGATETCYIEKVEGNIVTLTVTRKMRGDKMETSGWIVDTSTNNYSRVPKSVEKLETTPEHLFETHGSVTKRFLIQPTKK